MSNKSTVRKNSIQDIDKGIVVSWPYLYLILVSVFLYGKTIGFGFTYLDDSIFVIEFNSLNKKLSNFFHLFERGVFHEMKDTYYRPLLLVSFMFDTQYGGITPKAYHITNLILHVISVCLVYRVMIRLNTTNALAFLFALLFAVHPVLSQAVAWIPGRNDTMLCIFFLSAFLCFINYHQKGSLRSLAGYVLFAFLAAFTKETGVMLPAIALAYMILMPGSSNDLKKISFAVTAWLLVVGIYVLARTNAIVPEYSMGPDEIVQSIFARILIPFQYLGKIFFPFNLAVYPIMEDTSIVWGIASLILLGYIFFKINKSDYKPAAFGLLWFAILIFPALVVPKEINDQVFEHRLYLPILGIFILVAQVLTKLKKKQERIMFYSGLAVIALFASLTFTHINNFKNGVTFWEEAIETSPHSATAHALLAVRYYDLKKVSQAKTEAEASLKLNPKERYGNYILGRICLDGEKFAEAETHFKKELSLERPYFDSYFRLGHISFMLNKKDSAIVYLEKYVAVDSFNTQAYNNLMLLYEEQGKYAKAIEKAEQLGRKGEPVDDKMMNELKSKLRMQDSLVVAKAAIVVQE